MRAVNISILEARYDFFVAVTICGLYFDFNALLITKVSMAV